MRAIRRFLVGLFAALGLVTVLVVASVAIGGWWVVKRLEHLRGLPDSIVLVADLRGHLDDSQPGGLSALTLKKHLGLSDVVLALDHAAHDPHVKGLVARLDDTGHGLAAAQELREAVARFAATGRPAVAFADSFGELGPGNEGYYLATAFGRVTLQPVGLVGLTGLMAEVPFFKKLLDRLGIEADVEKREAYKTAFDSATETGLTPENREMIEQMLKGFSGQLVQGIAQGRKLDQAKVLELVNGGPYDAAEARAQHLIDDVGYWDEVLDRSKRLGKPVDLEDYAALADDGSSAGTVVAFVRASGLITQRGGLGGGIAADDLAQTIADAAESTDVRAVLLRIDSPGGSAVASETIARQVRRCVAAGKPVIVAMGNAAASGGYWIAMDATKILAQPATLTGSIGVIAAKPVLAGLWDRLGISWAQLSEGQHADMWSLNQPFAGSAQARVSQLLDSLYDAFKSGVATGRKLPPERVEEIAKGRVWLGSEAVELGLVDSLGGLFEAQVAIRSALKLAPDAALDLRPFPPPSSPLQRIADLLGADAGAITGLASALQMVLDPSPARIGPVIVH